MRMMQTLSFMFLVNTLMLLVILNATTPKPLALWLVLNGICAFVGQVGCLICAYDEDGGK